PLITVLAHMEHVGIRIDEDKFNSLSGELAESAAFLEEKVYKLAGEEFNLNSPKQLGEILFERLGLPVIKRTKTGYSTSADVLEQLKEHHEIIELILEYRQITKLKSTYIDALPPLINPRTGRIHTSFNQMVTSTGRLSSTNPNLQNIPIRTEEGRKVREFFIPREGAVFLSADYSQVELRVLAHISQDPGLLTAFQEGEDIHNQTAAEVFNVAPDEVEREHRRMAKVINFGIAYGMSPYGLARDLGVTREEAEEYIDKYFERFPGVKKYMDRTIAQARKEGYVTTIMGRRRYISQIKSRNYHQRSFAERAAINTPIQGSAADIMKKAMLDVFSALNDKYPETRILLQVHDELVLEVPEEKFSQVAKLVRKKMERTVKLDVPLLVDLKWGYNWRDTQKMKRGEG
ncbi:MAG: DNA polymerase I, partial [Halanaerobium sp.]|nr:DNA polymerase I [Halanaerobium sp.]